MNQSFWGIFVVAFGAVVLTIILLFQSLTNTDEHSYNLLKETTEAAMYDSIDQIALSKGEVRIVREKFVENFIRRFANNANLSRDYKIEIYDINEIPPKVSLKVSSTSDANRYASRDGEVINYDLSNRIDAILETPDKKK